MFQLMRPVSCVGEQRESLMHSLWLCDQAQFVWKSDPSFASLYQRQYRSFMDLISEVLNRFSTYRIALFSTIAWALWQRRNRLHGRQYTWSLQELGSRAKELIGEYFEANSQPSQCAPRPARVHWCPPLNSTTRGILMQLSLMLRVVQGLEWFFAITRVRLLLH